MENVDMKSTHKAIKRCRICGDTAKAFNYNGLTCEACKVFFRRNECDREALECRRGTNSCVVNNISNRKGCAKCRLEKCFGIGMDIKIVKNYVKHSGGANLQHQHALVQTDSPTQFTEYERGLIRQVLMSIRANFVDENQLDEIKSPDPTNMQYGFNLPAHYAKKIVRFCKRMESFKSRTSDEKLLLLKPFYSEFVNLRYIFMYDKQRDGFPVLANETGTKVIFLEFKNLEFLDDKSIGKEIRKYTIDLHTEMANDVVLRDLIAAQLLFTPRENMQSQEVVKYQYYVYSRLLRHYLELKYNSNSKGSQKYATLMYVLDNMNTIKKIIRNLLMTFQQVDKVLKEVHNIKNVGQNHDEDGQSLRKLS